MIEIIGEIGTNHNGDIQTAYQLIDIAAENGCHTVKLQIYDANDIVSSRVSPVLYGYQNDYSTWAEYINAKLITPKEWLPELVAYSHKKNLDIIATPHSLKNAIICLNAGIKRLKIASMDCNHIPFIHELSKLQVPLLLSTGMATRAEIIDAFETISAYHSDITLFHCVSTYPTLYPEVNLSFFEFLKTLTLNIALSDHSEKNDIAMMSVVYGIKAVEKHITLDKNQLGPDHSFALDAQGIRDLSMSLQNAQMAMGTPTKILSSKEQKGRTLYRRVMIANKPLSIGHIITENDFYFARPEAVFNDTIPPKEASLWVGWSVKMPLDEHQAIRREHFQ
ncbi:MAG: N-acetylneuraminate synthase family protein [Sulfuricurvum sp.]|uniref:N-acetylneuraminate synthase family protein n=1 Tax=Sulfuricurvum sp. TaxID=2025608 RepID=UPI0026345B70|nr:N-acetylneuraminate synthase family protein [Sulfuricurvum sp.]MDD2830176.1 N-acetylneuraminate synthase family protein [Sulfuricurvum sp.]MDD4949240.1 N-acetylneuraminate synthase family protein [Sulfuricurvum sp.]